MPLADLSLGKVLLQDVLKKALRRAPRKQLVGHLIERHRVSNELTSTA